MIELKEAVSSVNPPETNFGFYYFSHMIPPVKPSHMLMLGYGEGVVAELTRKIWGQVKITAVDSAYQATGYAEFDRLDMDAREFLVENARPGLIPYRYDYIAVDLWEGGNVCEFIYDSNFVKSLKAASRGLVCVNIPQTDFGKMEPYYVLGFKYERHVVVDGNMVIWWSVQE